jgi:hypothetical protein
MRKGFVLRILITISMLAATLAFGGCASGIVPPTAQVTSIALVDQSPQGASVQVTVELKSDNAVPLPLVECQFNVTVEGAGTYSFTDKPNKAIPAKRTDIDGGPASQVITLKAVFATAGRDVKGSACQVSGAVVYEPPGEVRKVLTDSYVPLPTVPFSGSGRLE